MKKILLILTALTVINAGAANSAPLWLRNTAIAPDGSRIAFTYKGDIYTVPVAGGEARRLTSSTTYETKPVWSPDGRRIAFASDINGNFDVFSTAVDGSDAQWRRHTFNSTDETPQAFTPDGKEIIYSAAVQAPAQSAAFPTRRLPQLYAVPSDKVLAPRLYTPVPALELAWAPDGKSFLYQDSKGMESEFRKHHRSSVTRDIWRYTPASDKHELVIDAPGEDLSPVEDDSYIYFISERDGAKNLNVYRAPKNNPSAAQALTSYKDQPVRSLSLASDGTLAYSYGGEIYTLRPGSRPVKVPVTINADYPADFEDVVYRSDADEYEPSTNGKSVALVHRGDIYVTSVEYSTTKRITDTPEAEGGVSWANDSTLYYHSERDGSYNIYRTSTKRGAPENDLVHATVLDTERVFDNDSHERTLPKVSPDGKKLAFILDRTKLAVKDLKSGKVRELTDGSTWAHRSGGFYYTWSPDSRWIALEVVDRKHDPYTDVAIINVETGQLTNITNSGYFDSEPRWGMDGDAIIFASERYGMRNHASWGSQQDVMAVFLNQDALERYRMSKEERELLPKKDNEKNDSILNIEIAGIDRRQVRLTPISTELIGFISEPDETTIYFSSSADDGAFIWSYDYDELELDMVRKVSDTAPTFTLSGDGKTMFVLGDKPYKFNGTKLTPVNYRATQRIDGAAERAYMFDNMAREEAQRFYVADMHGVDWPKMTATYRRFLPYINNKYDYADLLSELLGELNVSHTGARFTSSSDTRVDDRTASLGLIYDPAYTGPGLRIAEVLEQGPLFGITPAIEPGDIITAIDGADISPENPADILLNEKSGKRTLLSLKGADGKTRDIVVRPTSRSRENLLLYRRWVRGREALVDSLSNHRLGYVHIQSMDDDSFRKIYSDMLGKYNDREGIVIDIRWNGGGRLHEDIEVLFSGEKYFTQEIRGQQICDMPSRRWNKPSIMVINEACYSNAHGTPWVYTHKNLGKTVGAPVPGTMTSVNWVTMQDPDLYYGIPVTGYRLADGGFLENRQLEPDIKVLNKPAETASGRDEQIEVAVTELLRQIDAQ